MTLRIGFFGGAFNPPHDGHLRPALEAKGLLALDRLLFLPAGQHPFKPTTALLPAHHRVEMVRRAIRNLEGCELCTMDVDRPGVGYTIDTLRALEARYPDAERFFLLGADLLGELHLWRAWRTLIEHAHVCVMLRPGGEGVLRESEAARFLEPVRVEPPGALSRRTQGRWGYGVLPVTKWDVSSTLVRERLGRGEDVAGLAPAGVLDYIKEHRLYGGSGA